MTDMTWHYMACKKGGIYSVREVYHDLFNENDLLAAWTETSITPFGESREELIRDLEMMLDDVKKYPVLDITDEEEPKLVEPSPDKEP